MATGQLDIEERSATFGVVPEAVERANRTLEHEKRKHKLNFNTIPLDDKRTWDLISSGLTKGVFQLEKQLGKRYCKEVGPSNIAELADVISLIRPGCLEAEFREKPDAPGEYSSITNTYIKVKSGEWEPEYIHPTLEPILSRTFSVPIYQEQIMRICTDFAGFDLKSADNVRKALGKKLPEVLSAMREKFIAGAVSKGYDKDIANVIFDWIDKFSGYSFNASHAVSYALNGYKTAYAKANYPLEFFIAKLTSASGKPDTMDEIKELVHEARLFHIDVKPPNLRLLNIDFAKQDSKTIAFGLAHIKGVGDGAIDSLKHLKESTDHRDFLMRCFDSKNKVRSNVAEAIIKSGCVDYLGYNRIKLLGEYKLLNEMTKREREFIFKIMKEGQDTLVGFTQLMDSKVPNKARKPKLKESYEEINRTLGGNPRRMCIAYEKFLLGIPLSGSLVELYHNEKVNVKCRDFHKLKEGSYCVLGVVLEKIREIKDKNSNRMAFLSISDETYLLDSAVLFASYFHKVAWILEEGKPVLLTGKKSKGGLIVNKIEHL